MKILAVRMDKIGDTILSVPAFKTLRRMYPDAHLTILTNAYSAPVLQRLQLADEFIIHRYGAEDTTIKTVNDGHYDLLVALHDIKETAQLCKHFTIPKKVGPWRPPQQNRSAYPDGFPQTRLHYEDLSLIRHETEYTLDIVRHLDPELYEKHRTLDFHLPLQPDEDLRAAHFIKEHDLRAPLLFVTPAIGGSGLTLAPADWARVLREFHARQPDWQIVLGCYRPETAANATPFARTADSEYELCRQIQQQLTFPTHLFVNSDSFFYTLAMIKRSTLFLGSSTATFHAAWTQGVPAVGIFGNEPNHCKERWGILTGRGEHLVMDECKDYARTGSRPLRRWRRLQYSIKKRLHKLYYGEFRPKMYYSRFDTQKAHELQQLLTRICQRIISE